MFSQVFTNDRPSINPPGLSYHSTLLFISKCATQKNTTKVQFSAKTPNMSGYQSSGKKSGEIPGYSGHWLPCNVLFFSSTANLVYLYRLADASTSSKRDSKNNDNNNNGKAITFLEHLPYAEHPDQGSVNTSSNSMTSPPFCSRPHRWLGCSLAGPWTPEAGLVDHTAALLQSSPWSR